MLAQGWDKRPNVRILHGRWQDVVDQLSEYDGVFFDTYAEHYEHMRAFHSLLSRILKKDGIYTFFNGLAPGCPFLSKVYRTVVTRELAKLRLKTEYMELPVAVHGNLWDSVWKDVKTRYWHQGFYYLPIIYWQDAEVDGSAASGAGDAA
jgi:type IV protein arginine methyltransferase